MTRGDIDAARGELARRLGGRRSWVVRADAWKEALNRLDAQGKTISLSVLSEDNELCDLRKWGDRCRRPSAEASAQGHRSDPARKNTLLAADVSAVSCYGCAAARLGAHVAIDDLSLVWEADDSRDLRAVCLSRDAERTRPGLTALLDAAQDQAALTTDEAAALLASLRTLDARLRVLGDHAQAVAAFLACHPQVACVSYPGLPADPGHQLAATLLQGGFGPWVVYARADAPHVRKRLLAGPQDPRATCLELEASLA